jgi:exonuclease SbcC
MRGLTRFDETVSINFSALPGGLIALVAPNGAGKTTIMESIPAAVFRGMPSREGALPHHVQGRRDAFVELDFSMGSTRRRSHIKIDGHAGNQEAYLYDADGTPLVSGKLKEYDAAITELVGMPDLFYASVFQSQGRKGNFLDLGKADRKALMIRMLGLEQLQVISDKAGKRATALEQEITVARTKLQNLDGQLSALEDLRHSLSVDEAKLQEAQGAVAAARTELQRLIEEEARIKASLGRATELRRALGDLSLEISSLETKRVDLLGRLANNRKLVGQAAEVRAAVTMLQTLEKELTAKRDAIVQADQERETLLEEQQKTQAHALQAADLDRRIADLVRAAGDAKSQTLINLDAEIRQAEKNVNTCGSALARSEDKIEALVHDLGQKQLQAKVLGEIPCGDAFPTCSLISNAVFARDAIADIEETLSEERQGLAMVRQDLARDQEALKQMQVKRTEIAAAPVEEPAEVLELREQVAQLRKQAQGPEAGSAIIAIRSAIAKLQAEAQAIETRIAEARKTADLLPRLETAETRIAELEAEIAQVDQECTVKAGKVAELERELAVAPSQQTIDAAAAARVAAEQSLKTQEEVVGYHQGRVAAGKARIADLEALQPERDALADRLEDLFTHLADWKHLQRAFGKDGIQALEIDAAGPEVSALINDLLVSCFGPRFTLSFETTAAKADGKGEKEVFDIRIIDNERGREGKLETLSGGEKVILNEAISLALAIYNSRKSGLRFETLFRDETAGALDPQNAERYMQMLRRALELGGFHQLVFIAHSQDLWEQADARVFVKGGKVTVDSPSTIVQMPGRMAEVA